MICINHIVYVSPLAIFLLHFHLAPPSIRRYTEKAYDVVLLYVWTQLEVVVQVIMMMFCIIIVFHPYSICFIVMSAWKMLASAVNVYFIFSFEEIKLVRWNECSISIFITSSKFPPFLQFLRLFLSCSTCGNFSRFSTIYGALWYYQF